MRRPLFEPRASKQTVSLTLNSDLYAKAKSAGVNASKVAEEAIAAAYAELRRDKIIAELREDLAAAEGYAEQHGSFPDHVRQHYDPDDSAI
jgi:post-segregation antitoxin (ccd killing protein)